MQSELLHSHDFTMENPDGERNSRRVMWLTIVMMVIEIIGGQIFGSMALLADGWHMGTHAFALGLTVFIYHYSRKHRNNPKFAFGTGKVNALGSFASALLLAGAAFLMIYESAHRLLNPEQIAFNEAILVAFVGLIVNLVSAVMLHGHDHGHAHGHHHHDHHGHDHNLKAAYLHVVADALTSVFAIIALFAGKYFGWVFLDPVLGIVGGLVICKWGYNLIRETGGILLDYNLPADELATLRDTFHTELPGTEIQDLHVWRVSNQHYCVALSVKAENPQPVATYHQVIGACNARIVHATVEILA